MAFRILQRQHQTMNRIRRKQHSTRSSQRKGGPFSAPSLHSKEPRMHPAGSLRKTAPATSSARHAPAMTRATTTQSDSQSQGIASPIQFRELKFGIFSPTFLDHSPTLSRRRPSMPCHTTMNGSPTPSTATPCSPSHTSAGASIACGILKSWPRGHCPTCLISICAHETPCRIIQRRS